MKFEMYKVDQNEIREMSMEGRYMTAMALVRVGEIFTDVAILTTANKQGWSIAHEMASRGMEILHPHVLNLKDNNGVSVHQVLESYSMKCA